MMKVLIACEYSGIVSRAFADKGHDVTSCDLLPSELGLFSHNAYRHIIGNAIDLLDKGFDLMIAHPPCTYLSFAGNRWWEDSGRKEKRENALNFCIQLYNSPIERVCLENPLGYLSSFRKQDQIIHPYMFGDAYKKRTCLWLKNLPLLIPTNIVTVRDLYFGSGKKKMLH